MIVIVRLAIVGTNLLMIMCMRASKLTSRHLEEEAGASELRRNHFRVLGQLHKLESSSVNFDRTISIPPTYCRSIIDGNEIQPVA